MQSRMLGHRELPGLHHSSSVEPRQDEEPMDLLRMAMDRLPIGVLILFVHDLTDLRSSKIVDLNAEAARVLGSKIEKLRGKRLAEFPGLLKASVLTCCVE